MDVIHSPQQGVKVDVPTLWGTFWSRLKVSGKEFVEFAKKVGLA